MSGMKGQTGGRRCEKPEGSREKEGSNAGGTGRGWYRKQSEGGWREKKKSDEAQRKMKTVREITGKPGRMCNERRERGTEGGEKGGGDEKEVISGLFLTAFCQPPSEIFRGETYRSCVLEKIRGKKGCITAGEKVCEARK